MKKILIELINIYQKIPGDWHLRCRYVPSCSQYMIDAIYEFGSFKGFFLGMRRILRCNPWGSSGYDPVPVNKKGRDK